MIITVSGNSGCGKSTFSKVLSENLKFKYIDVDAIVAEMYQDEVMQKTLFSNFGVEVVNNEGRVEKKLVGKYVFQKKSRMDKLNELTWGYIENKLDSIIESFKNVVIDYKFIPITKYFAQSQCNILVKAKDEEKRLQKIIERDGISKEYLIKRESNGVDYSKYNFDYIVENDYSQDYFDECQKVILKIKEERLWV